MGDVKIDSDVLKGMLDAAAEAGARAAVAAFSAMPKAQTDPAADPNAPSPLPSDQQKEIAYAKATGQPIADRTPKKERRIECETHGLKGVSSDGATFTAVIVDRPGFPNGVVLRLEDYKEPTFTEDNIPKGTHQAQADGNIDPLFRNWKWNTFWKADLLRYVGHDAGELPRAPVSADKAKAA